MKKVISLLLSIILIMISLNVYAAESKIDILGETTAKQGETKILTAKVNTNGDAIGVISAEISYSENISNIEISSKNGWQVTYNSSNGKLNALKAEGAKSEEFIEIKYTVKSEPSEKATIKLSKITMSTIEYSSTNVNDIVKNIEIEKETQITKELSEISISKKPNKITYTEGEKVNNDGLVVIAKYNDGTSTEIKNYKYSPTGELKVTDKKVEISYTENSITKTASYEITVNEEKADQKEEPKDEPKEEQKEDVKDTNKKDDTTVGENNKLPQTGSFNYVLIAVVIISVIGLICYYKFKKYTIN